MKTKLLKEVRKRYSITHYPQGLRRWGDTVKGPITILKDKKRYLDLEGLSTKIKEKAYDDLYKILITWIKRDYKHTKKKSKQKDTFPYENLWYK